tara:strand:+ start:612 stop:944 length:333 start_codon:yes stop_codon:yes gene_type:complete
MENNVKLDATKVGDLLELQAVCWLLKQGYEVFRNDCACGPVDIIALNKETNEILKIDVKTTHLCDDQKRIRIPKLRELQVKLGVKILTFNEKTNDWILVDGKTKGQHILA